MAACGLSFFAGFRAAFRELRNGLVSSAQARQAGREMLAASFDLCQKLPCLSCMMHAPSVAIHTRHGASIAAEAPNQGRRRTENDSRTKPPPVRAGPRELMGANFNFTDLKTTGHACCWAFQPRYMAQTMGRACVFCSDDFVLTAPSRAISSSRLFSPPTVDKSNFEAIHRPASNSLGPLRLRW